MGMQDLRVQRMGNEGVNLGQMFPPTREVYAEVLAVKTCGQVINH